jgi:hypothetical protein
MGCQALLVVVILMVLVIQGIKNKIKNNHTQASCFGFVLGK